MLLYLVMWICMLLLDYSCPDTFVKWFPYWQCTTLRYVKLYVFIVLTALHIDVVTIKVVNN